MSKTRASRIIDRFGGKCAKCFGPGPFEIDHPLTLWMGAPDEDAECEPLCQACHAKKTAQDATDRAKVKRIIAREDGTRRERRPIPGRGFQKGKRAIPSRPFPKRPKEPRPWG